jgi:aryl-alcohol dehydrogenase-like predicted oxidoreductase
MDRIIRGGWQLHAAASVDVEAEARRVLAFMDAGVTTFETSDTYKHVDAVLSRAAEMSQAEGSARPKVHTRLTLPCDVASGLHRMAERLGRDHLDLVQVQDWALDEDRVVAACEIAARHRSVGNLGLMNMSEEMLDRLWARGVRPRTVQVQFSLLDRRPLRGLCAWAMAHGVGVLAYGTLAGGLLDARWLGRADPGLRPTSHAHFHAEYRAVVDAFGGWDLYQDLLRALSDIAGACSATIPDVALRWVLDQPGVAAALVGASDPARATSWQRAAALTSPADAAAKLDAVLSRSPGVPGPVGWLERQSDGAFARAIAANRREGDGYTP